MVYEGLIDEKDTRHTKNLFIPKYDRILAANSSTDHLQTNSLSDRLNRMRLEDRRHARNVRMQKCTTSLKHNDNPSSSSSPEGSSLKPDYSSKSASTRAGTAFLASNFLSKREVEQQNIEDSLRRRFAGPIPPNSWRRDPLQSHKCFDKTKESPKDTIRTADKARLLAARNWFPRGTERLQDSLFLPSLVDLCSEIVRSSLAHPEYVSEDQMLNLRREAASLPTHLKEHMMSLSGRFAKTDPITESVLSALFAVSFNTNVASEKSSKEQQVGEVQESWDQDANHEDSQDLLQCLDLSFGLMTSNTLRSLAQAPLVRGHALRSFSLAGWGSQPSSQQPQSCLRSAENVLLEILQNMPSLEVLSLSDTKLLLAGDEACQGCRNGKLSVSAASEALAFLRNISKSTRRLRVLDLSSCPWVNGAVIANLGWYSTNPPIQREIWPNLTALILTGCEAFLPSSLKPKESQTLSLSAPFSAKWHAAHHGERKSTDSPYFLSHRPGLGQAVLTDGVGAWDLMSQSDVFQAERKGLKQIMQPMLHHSSSSSTPTTHRGNNISSDASDSISDFLPSAAFFSRESATSADAVSGLPRCPVSGAKVERFEWERARVLDAVYGRWGSAISGRIDDDRGPLKTSHCGWKKHGTFVELYF